MFFMFSLFGPIYIKQGAALTAFSVLCVIHINRKNLFIELLLDQHLVIFVYFNRLLLIHNDFLYNHNLINIQ